MYINITILINRLFYLQNYNNNFYFSKQNVYLQNKNRNYNIKYKPQIFHYYI